MEKKHIQFSGITAGIMIALGIIGAFLSTFSGAEAQAAASDSGTVSLTITSTSGGCYYGKTINMGTGKSQTTPQTLSGVFYSSGRGNSIASNGTSKGRSGYNSGARGCVDLAGNSGRVLSIKQSEDLKLNGGADSISSGNVKISFNTGVSYQWGGPNGMYCTGAFNSYYASGAVVNTITKLLERSSTNVQTGALCEYYMTGVKLSVDVPPYKTPGLYTGTITITIPNL